MSKKLDARSGGGGASGNLKWIRGTAGALGVTVGVLLYMDNNTNVQAGVKKSNCHYCPNIK